MVTTNMTLLAYDTKTGKVLNRYLLVSQGIPINNQGMPE